MIEMIYVYARLARPLPYAVRTYCWRGACDELKLTTMLEF